MAALPQNAPISRWPAGERGCHLQLQPHLWAGNDRLGTRGHRTARLPTQRAGQSRASVLSGNRQTHQHRLAAIHRVRPPVSRDRRRASATARIGSKPTERLLRVCETDAVVAAQFFKVSGLVDPPTRLLKPSIVRRLATSRHQNPWRVTI